MPAIHFGNDGFASAHAMSSLELWFALFFHRTRNQNAKCRDPLPFDSPEIDTPWLLESLSTPELDDIASTYSGQRVYWTGTLQALAFPIAVSRSLGQILIEANRRIDDTPDKHDQRPKIYISPDPRRPPFLLSTQPSIISFSFLLTKYNY